MVVVKQKGVATFGKRKPGPPALDAMPEPEKDLSDAAKLLQLIEGGSLKSSPSEGTSERLITVFGQRASRLSAKEEAALARRVQQFGDIDARNALVVSNIGLVHLIANQFFRPPLRYEDLLQEGTLGLIRATETFEPDRNIRFSTYSVYWIRAKIQRHIQRNEKEDIPNIIGADFSTDDGGRMQKPRARKLSTDHMFDNDDNRSLGDLLATDIHDPESVALAQEKKKMIADILEEIVRELGDPRLRTIIQMRMLADEPVTLSVLGEKLHLSREGTRLLESKMLRLARLRLREFGKPV